MTIEHHPDEALLMDYSTGALTEGWSLALAVHLAICPDCRKASSQFDAIGGCLLGVDVSNSVSDMDIDAIMARLDDDISDAAPTAEISPPTTTPLLPEPLRTYVGGDVDSLNWQRLGLGAYQLLINLNGAQETARLLRIPAGKPVPEHSHRGREITLVLSGAFEDVTGHYARGDLQEADESLNHQPVAMPGKDCICLAVTDAPLRFRNAAVRFIQPLLGI